MLDNVNPFTVDAVEVSGGSSGDCIIQFPEASVQQRRTNVLVHSQYATQCCRNVIWDAYCRSVCTVFTRRRLFVFVRHTVRASVQTYIHLMVLNAVKLIALFYSLLLVRLVLPCNLLARSPFLGVGWQSRSCPAQCGDRVDAGRQLLCAGLVVGSVLQFGQGQILAEFIDRDLGINNEQRLRRRILRVFVWAFGPVA